MSFMKLRVPLAGLACSAALLSGTALVQSPAVALSPAGDVTSASAKAAVIKASGRLTLRPGLSQPGRGPAAPSNKTQAVATFSGTRTGQQVALQRETGTGWKTVARARQHSNGATLFSLPDTTSTYRAVALTSGGAAAAVTGTVRGRSFKPIFEDTFSGSTVNFSKWSDQKTITPAYMRMCSRISPNARSVSGGVLRMGVAPDRTRAGKTCRWRLNGRSGSHPYMWNTQLYTGGKFDFTYGYAAARMKMHRGRGMHASFWLQPANWYTPGQPAKGTEIDVVEYFGASKSGSNIASFVHWYDSASEHHKRGGLFPQANALKPAGHAWWNAFHVFSVEWTPNAYIFRVDGREFHRETQVVSRAPEYLLLSMLTSDYELERLTPATLRQSAAVDWVRVWKG